MSNHKYIFLNFQVAQMVKNLPAMQETQVLSLGKEDPLEEGMAAHSSILAYPEIKLEISCISPNSWTRLSD